MINSKLRASNYSQDRQSIFQFKALLILKLLLDRIKIYRKRIPSPRRWRLRLARRFQIIDEHPAPGLRLRRLEPVHVIVDIVHSRDNLGAGCFQARETLRQTPLRLPATRSIAIS